MPALDLDRLRAHGRSFVSGFTPGQKAVTVLGAVALLVGGYVFMQWASTPDLAPLYTDLEPADAAAVTEELAAQGVAYDLSDGGRTILVPRADVYDLRIAMSAQGLPSDSGEGYALLDEGGITQSEFSQRIDYQRALQGELGRTIASIDGIGEASVTITLPEDSVFVEEQEDATAAVLVEPEGADGLDPETVQAIVHLVASSVPDLSPEGVTVADATGRVLAAPGDSSLTDSQNLGKTVDFERHLASQVEQLIATALGPGHAAVTVNAELNFDETVTRRTTYRQPQNTELLLSEVAQDTEYTGPGAANTGILGPDGTPLLPGNDTPVDFTETKADRRFALDSVEQTVNEAPGSIDGLSIAVLLDSEVVAQPDVARWTDVVSAAAGIDERRGDTVEVTAVPFDTSAAEAAKEQLEAARAEQSKGFLMSMVRYVVTFLVVGLVLFFAWRSVKKAHASRPPLRVPIDLRELEAAEQRFELDATDSAEPLAVPRPAKVLEPARSEVEEEIGQLIERQPDEVAQTLRSWLADRRS